MPPRRSPRAFGRSRARRRAGRLRDTSSPPPWRTWDVLERPIAELADFCRGFSPSRRRQLLWSCNSCLLAPETSTSRSTGDRIAAVKVMLALMPESTATVFGWIAQPPVRRPWDVHFTVFCYLDEVVSTASGGVFARSLLRVLRDYLLRLRTDAGKAGWMAAGLLGQSWPPAVATPILVEVVENAAHRQARSAAMRGISDLLDRATGPRAAAFRRVLRRAARHDRSRHVRASARVALMLNNRSRTTRAPRRAAPGM